MDGLVSGQLDSLLQINREQSESSFVPSNMLLVYALVLTQDLNALSLSTL